MKRLKIFILLFGLALTVPVTYFVYHSYQGLENEELEELRFFSETLFDRMEDELEEIVRREESRAIDEYSSSLGEDKDSGNGFVQTDGTSSPLSETPQQPYILGYFQNSPDGSLQSPLHLGRIQSEDQKNESLTELKRLNSLFNRKRTSVSLPEPVSKTVPAKAQKKKKEYGLGAKYLRTDRLKKQQKASLGREKKRVEKITIAQARNIVQAPLDNITGQLYETKKDVAVTSSGKRSPTLISSQDDDSRVVGSVSAEKESKNRRSVAVTSELFEANSSAAFKRSNEQTPIHQQTAPESGPSVRPIPTTFQIEVDPLQSIQLDVQHIFLFRRIVLDNRIYRQGLVLKINEFLHYLGGKYFTSQPLSSFTNLRFSISSAEKKAGLLSLGADVKKAKFQVNRTFPRPFSLISARLTCEKVPDSASRRTLIIMMSVLVAVIFLGLFSIYQSASVQVDLSRRRSGFVSSVTHELKTPLTNIRMYIEMLEQGIANDTNREKEYFRILGSESARLTRLINNILEFSKLENKKRQVSITAGTLDDVIIEVKDVMNVKLKQEGFTFKVRKEPVPSFLYDKEAMIQILINLIDNSIKFGREAEQKVITLWIRLENNRIKISVSDTGSGLPEEALNKVFDDFYRVDNSLTRRTSGTGIGLALVKKFSSAMGGTVTAENNRGQGCVVTISLPLKES